MVSVHADFGEELADCVEVVVHEACVEVGGVEFGEGGWGGVGVGGGGAGRGG